MNLGPIIEVSIGLVFVWIVLSLTTIQIQEWISVSLDKRANDMEDAIHEMLANPNLKSQFYDHPVIRSLTARQRKIPSFIPTKFYNYPIIRGFTQEKRKIPSYIPAQQFALSLFDIAMTAGTESSLIQQGIFKIRDDLNKNKGGNRDQAAIDALNILADLARSAASTEARTSITNIGLDLLKKKADEFSLQYPKYKLSIDATLTEAQRLKSEIDLVLKSQELPKDTTLALTKLRQGVTALSVISPELNQTLNTLLLNVEEYAKEGETHLAKARENIENWFDDSMDRVSGVFKRYAQRMALLTGLAIALFLNVDSINLTFYLWREPAVRQALAEQASTFELPQQDFNADPNKAMQDFREQFVGLKLPIGWTIKDKSDPMFVDSGCKIFPVGNEFFGIPLFRAPIIKEISAFNINTKCITPSQPDHATNIIIKFFGILFTALAARQGAPFWFDLLKRLVNLRGTGANPIEQTVAK